jgi:hypothetical protein
MSFLKEQKIINNNELEEILSSKQETYLFDTNKKQFIKTVNEKYDKEQIFYKKINQIDGVYYFSKNINDINVNENNN